MERQVKAQAGPAIEEEIYEAELLGAYFIWAEADHDSVRREVAWERYCRIRDSAQATVH